MEVVELRGVGPVLAARLEAVGLGTIESVAQAPIEELAAVPGVGPKRGADMKNQARFMLAPADSPRAEASASSGHATVSRAVEKLRRQGPDLAKSKKHAKNLKSASKRMSGLAADLDTRKSRKRLIAEASRIQKEATKRTASKRDAKDLRKLAGHVEDSVRSIA